MAGKLMKKSGKADQLPSGGFDQRLQVEKKFLVEVCTAGAAVPSEEIMPCSGRCFGGRARGDVVLVDVINGDRDFVFLAPVLGELVEPSVVSGNEMTPLHNRERGIRGEPFRHERRRERRRQADSPRGQAGRPQEVSARD
jgi:hypothetical protein